MTGEHQASGIGELSRLLQQLGQEPVQPRSREQENARAQATAELLDRQLRSLVQARRARLLRLMPLAAAAALLLGFGAWRLGLPGADELAIEQEPLPPGTRSPQPAPLPPAPEVEPPARPALPQLLERPRAAASSSVSSEAAPESSVAEPQSTLAEENRLFKEAAEATRAGNTDVALQHLDRLIDTYPSSPLTQTALVRKLRLLEKSGRGAAAERAARRYLELYPNGFAASEARQLLGGAPSPAPAATEQTP